MIVFLLYHWTVCLVTTFRAGGAHPFMSLFTTTVAGGITFAYRDTGPPNVSTASVSGGQSYNTLVMVHGHTCHSGVFTKLNGFATQQHTNLRIISINRRSYPGSTPYTDEELRILTSGTFDERSGMFDREGEYLAMFVNNIINEHGLQEIIVVGWSLGAAYLNMLVDAMKQSSRLDEMCKERLRKCVRGFVYLDAPSNALGVSLPNDITLPIHDPTLPPTERRSSYGKLLSSYFPHPDLSNRDVKKLILTTESIPNTPKPPTFTSTSPEEFSKISDSTAGSRGDNNFNELYLGPILLHRMKRALLDPEVREMWVNARFWWVYGEESAWNVIWSAWCVEDMIHGVTSDRVGVEFKSVKGVNHFMVYDSPGIFLEVITSCMTEEGLLQ